MRLLQGILLPALLAAIASMVGGVSAKKDKPSLTRTEFKTEPGNLFYFEDSQVVLMIEVEEGKVWRTDNEGDEWNVVDDIKSSDKPYALLKNQYDSNVAVALGKRKIHWITYDKGKSWRQFTTDEHPSQVTIPIAFNAADNKKLLYSSLEKCLGTVCIGNTYYTDDGFESTKILIQKRKLCEWAVATDLIAERGDINEDRILCIVEGKYGSHSPSKYRLLYSDNYFEDQTEMKIDGQTMTGFASIAAVKGFLVVAAATPGSHELALYTSMDAETWHKAEFGDHHVEESAYTVLESTNYSIQVDVQTADFTPMGVLFSSNSEGRFFTNNVEHTNRNERGFVDFEKVSNIQGVIIVNVVKNYKDLQGIGGFFGEEKQLITQLSFDDGRTFHDLKYKDKALHLHSVTDLANSGRVFSSPAPGLIMGVGNTGDSLKPYKDGDLYVSDDGGLTWNKALEEAHKYEFGDQGSVLVAVFDEGPTKEIRYSLKHGKDEWRTLELENEMRAVELTTNTDSTSLRFILIGTEGSGKKKQWVSYTINFDDMHERDCGEKDFETWHARVDEDGNAMCIMGRKQSFHRRKADADCFVKEFEKPELEWDICECTEADYECDAGFTPEWSGEGDKKEKKCVVAGRLDPPDDACQGDDETFMGSSGWRKIPGNQCKGGTKKDKEMEHECSETKNPPGSGKISTEITSFPEDNLAEYYYLERNGRQGDDETVVMRTTDNTVYITRDHGKTWGRPKAIGDDEIVAIYPHQYFNDVVYFITASKKVYYSKDRCKTIHDFEAPSGPNRAGLQILQFHPNKDGWLIWTGQDKTGTPQAWKTQRDGLEWHALARAVSKCQFMFSDVGHDVDEQLVYCEQHTNEDPSAPLQLVSSKDWFANKDVVFDDVVSFATMSEFIVVASKTEDRKNLKLDASIDGKNFADAQFPPKFTVEHQQAYTVLDSSTHSVFLHVTVNAHSNSEYGTIIKSNSNGTSYVLSVNEVNRNEEGYVDFEKMQGLEGVAIINVVQNKEQVDNGAGKKKRTLITHNDGADWALLSNVKDAKGEKNLCNDNGCSLHLHGYTERSDPRATFSSASAVGLMMGVGNVGTELSSPSDANTFLTQDGGVTWNQVKSGPYMWEYGDQGSIIVLVKKNEATDHVLYSTDEGDSWTEYPFTSSDSWNIELITTVPSDTSMNFLLWGKQVKGKNRGKLGTVNLDFSGLFDRKCELDDDNPLAGDYEFWTPKHPSQDTECLFGHIAKYHRKKRGELCYNGERRFDDVHEQEKCECTRRDWECDYNYERQNDGSCLLVEGLSPSDPKDVCQDKDVVEYHTVTGYRKVPISTCEGGRDLRAETLPCPGHEEEYNEKHGTSGFVIFLAIVLPITAAAGVGYWVYQNWDGKFGRIRLGDGYSSFDSNSPWISWPIAAVSGLIAVLATIPLLVGSLWRSASSRFGGGRGYGSRTYTSRASFGRGDYAIVDPDEGELLGDDSDEDV
ncbi:glycosyl hydrolase [Pseudovirgaria hyperparasitica]|uniref:Vacuolar protein sorting/targeting protein 10 n=1 Tax=Pseudovirgaria hyperparasitica TaxID=470096 RepID=A0A6A6W3Z7_9PEZI|nr:glycosyl hydrolase [Pseudovirgaria hyperparasitica]KAF2756754.1 glycosyl hydrolase [Pseudovirgaria hyperparasitica]